MFKMDFYKTAAFATPYTENDYPLSIPLNEFLYVKYSVESSADLVIMAENCIFLLLAAVHCYTGWVGIIRASAKTGEF